MNLPIVVSGNSDDNPNCCPSHDKGKRFFEIDAMTLLEAACYQPSFISNRSVVEARFDLKYPTSCDGLVPIGKVNK